MRMKCGTCQGEYVTEFADGTRYFHACPPLVLVSVSREGEGREIPLAELVPTDRIMVLRGGSAIETTIAQVLPDDRRIGDREVPRPNARNENVDPTKTTDRRPMIAEGRGAVAVP